MSEIRAFIGAGANLGDPISQIDAAAAALDAVPRVRLTGRSRLYGSKPVGPQDQPDYVNAVFELQTSLAATALLDACLRTESALGRVRGRRWGERAIDLDLLLYGADIIDAPRLTVPHPELTRRTFVLRPLADLAPELEIPGTGATVATLSARCTTPQIHPLERT